MEVGAAELCLIGGKEGGGVLENGYAHRKETTTGMGEPVVVKRDCDLRRSVAASSMSLETPMCKTVEGLVQKVL